jgi:catechol-2,3-dioxygenase
LDPGVEFWEQALYKDIGENMKFAGTLICVKNIAASRKFYQDLFGLKVKFDSKRRVSYPALQGVIKV